jgi:hypothetical protein
MEDVYVTICLLQFMYFSRKYACATSAGFLIAKPKPKIEGDGKKLERPMSSSGL